MRTGVITQKVGMTRLFLADGTHVPVTVLKLDGCAVVAWDNFSTGQERFLEKAKMHPAFELVRGDKLIDVAKKCGADAIHPGYGFLSENAEFVRQVNAAGITFIGPPPEAMEAMGGKISARKLAIDAGVPVVPGATEPLSSYDDAAATAKEIGYPVMLKASAGGGGKGMRLVFEASELRSALETAQSEARAVR